MNRAENIPIALAQIESRLERLLEGSFHRLFGGKIEPADLANRLARAMEDGQVVAAGRLLVPNRYEVALHPTDSGSFQSFETILSQELSAFLMDLAQRRHYFLVGRPQINLVMDNALKPGDILVTARLVDISQSGSDFPQQHTRPMRVPTGIAPHAAAPTAYLVHEGRHIPLDTPFVTIGRHTDNDIILEAKAVSRYHANIKLRQSRYYLLDLASANGTSVNGRQINEGVLQDGDIISLGGAELVFRQTAGRPQT